MSGLVFDYTRNRLDVRIRQAAEYDYLYLMVRARGGGVSITDVDRTCEGFEQCGGTYHNAPVLRITCPISSVFCPFRDMLAWLEAASTGVSSCSTSWNAEGPIVALELSGDRLEIHWTQRLYRQPERPLRENRLSALVDRRQVIGAFYAAILGFASSSDYHPERYERELSIGEQLSLGTRRVLSSAEWAGLLAGLDAAFAEFPLQRMFGGPARSSSRSRGAPWPVPDKPELVRAFAGIMSPAQVVEAWASITGGEDMPAYAHIPSCWRRMDRRQRATFLRNLFAQPFGTWFGAPLRSLRSRRIEDWLASSPRPSA